MLEWDFCGYFLLLFKNFLSFENAVFWHFLRKWMGKREENREFFVGGLNMETERKKRNKTLPKE